mgnify:CR=1 FL=1
MIKIEQTNSQHLIFCDAIIEEMEHSAKVRGTGIAKRSVEYLSKKIIDGNGIEADHSLVVFVFYSEDDLIDLLRLYAHGIQLLICNHCPRFMNKFSNIKNIAVLDCLETKMGYREDLRFYFNQKFVNTKYA